MKITKAKLVSKLQRIAKENAPVRIVYDSNGQVKTNNLQTGRLYTKSGRPASRAVGKRGTNMYSPYPGNLKNNGVVAIENGVKYDYNKVGYIGYANLRSKKPQFIEKTIDDFCNFCVSLGGRIRRR